ncbi:MAG: hypothetical protein E7457_00680 [Ruminococcaceae bacterium]|nr:hypothetical protein [Oscillospiraceae bacterium]
MSNQYEEKNSTQPQKGADIGSWIIIAVMFGIAWPVGLILLINKLNNGTKKQRRRKTVSRAAGTASPAESTGRKTPVRQQMTSAPQYGENGARAMKIIGTVLAVIGALAAVSILSDLGFYIEYGYLWDMVGELFHPVGLFAGGIALLQAGRGMTRRSRRFAKYLAVAGEQKAVSLARLAEAAELPVTKVEKDLEIMIEKGYWGRYAFVDLSRGMLFLSQRASADWQKETEEQKPAPVQQESTYSRVLRDLRRANDRIADPILSEKIDRLEQVAQRIFQVIETDETKRAKASKFLNYYLPTTQKLLDAYAEFEDAGIRGSNVDQTKKRIETTMDGIVEGFERQLDELYRDDAMDIESDIRVMKTMLRNDSASAEEDFGLGTAVAEE